MLIPPILTQVIIRNPEVLRTEIWNVAEFTLLMMTVDAWSQNESCMAYLAVLFAEGDPTDLTDTVLQIADRTNKGLPYEQLLNFLFAERPDMLLPQSVIGKIIGWLVRRDSLSEDHQGLFRTICKLEPEKVRKYAVAQPASIKAQISTFLQPYSRTKSPPKKSSPPVVQGEPKQLMNIMRQEMKNGNKCDFGSFLAAFHAFPYELSPQFGVEVIDLVGKLREKVISEHQAMFDRMCSEMFSSPSSLEFLGDEWVPADRLVGLSRVMWSASTALLDGSERWLPVLYDLFLDSVGRVRRSVATIFIAIREVTGYSVIDLPEVKEPYRSSIIGLMAEYSIERDGGSERSFAD
jgi:hypothetical protein